MLNATLRARTGQPAAPQVQHSLKSFPVEARAQPPHQGLAVPTPSRLQCFSGDVGLSGAGLEGGAPAPAPFTQSQLSLDGGAQQGPTRNASLRPSVSLVRSELRGVSGFKPTAQSAAGSADPSPATQGHSAAGPFDSLSVCQGQLQPQESWARQLQLQEEEEDQPAAAAAAIKVASASQQMQGTWGSIHGIIQSLNSTRSGQVGCVCAAKGAPATLHAMPCARAEAKDGQHMQQASNGRCVLQSASAFEVELLLLFCCEGYFSTLLLQLPAGQDQHDASAGRLQRLM